MQNDLHAVKEGVPVGTSTVDATSRSFTRSLHQRLHVYAMSKYVTQGLL